MADLESQEISETNSPVERKKFDVNEDCESKDRLKAIVVDMVDLESQEISETNSPVERKKFDVNKDCESKDTGIDLIASWQNFEVKRVLNNNVVRKQIWLEGNFKGHESTAIVLLEKKNFPEEETSLMNFFNEETMLKNVFDNDAYGSYECFPIKEHNGEYRVVFCS